MANHKMDNYGDENAAKSIPKLRANNFWKGVMSGCKQPLHAIFKDTLLVVSGHGLKLFTKRPTADQARDDYRVHMAQYFRMEYLDPENCWVDLGMEDTPEPMDRQGLLATNPLRRGGVAYNKAYNLHKDVFATPHKELGPFELRQLEGLGYGQMLLSNWYEASRHSGRTSHPAKRAQLLGVYDRLKRRLAVALADTQGGCFGARKEFQVRLDLLDEMDLSDGQDARGHLPYYVLPTRDVNCFVTANINRWLLCLEALTCQAQEGGPDLAAALQQWQMINGIMVSAVVRTLRASLGEHKHLRSCLLWDASWMVSGSGEEETMLELDYRTTVRRHGLAWLPARHVLWDDLSAFAPEVANRLGLAKNGFGGRLRGGSRAQKALKEENCFYADFGRVLRQILEVYDGSFPDKPQHLARNGSHSRVLWLAAELVVQEYLPNVMKLLWARDPNLESWKDRLDTNEEAGLEAFTYEMAERMMRWPPHPGIKERRWDNLAFWVRARRLRQMLAEANPDLGWRLSNAIMHVASAKLWIVPQYNVDKLLVQRKATKYNAWMTAAHLRALPNLDRINWNVLQLVPHLHNTHRTIQQRLDQGLALKSRHQQGWQEIRKALFKWDELGVLSHGGEGIHTSGVARDPKAFDLAPILRGARWFHQCARKAAQLPLDPH
ncbi:MAG: hypothetical protein M1832_004932 [Thelocarpon impressellum]|nr:MAG: hypothetical protein M1832_004932 [Thelocarpon impressellum]